MNRLLPLAAAVTVALAAGLGTASSALASSSLSISVLARRVHVTSGQHMGLAVRVESTGTDTATGITACLTPPPQLVVTSAAGAERQGHRVCFAVGELPPGAQATRAIVVRAAATRLSAVRAFGHATSACTCSADPTARSPLIVIRAARAKRPVVTG